MEATVWGCRGSLATPGPATVRYGGNTSCLELRSAGGALVVIDAGTGIRPLGASLAARPVHEIDLLLTHLHLDHIEGLGFFAPLFDEACSIRIWGPHPGAALADHLSAYLSPPYFPVPFDRLPARITFQELERERWQVGGLTVECAPVSHPGRTLGFRMTERGRSLAFIPDNEPGLDRRAGLALADGVDVLFHDAQYTDHEYLTRVGWGHASASDLAAFLAAAAPRRTLMFHHDPAHSDAELEEMLAAARSASPAQELALAHEGLRVALPAY